jgi:hypothetical protein
VEDVFFSSDLEDGAELVRLNGHLVDAPEVRFGRAEPHRVGVMVQASAQHIDRPNSPSKKESLASYIGVQSWVRCIHTPQGNH